jgi:hypothetical protein
MSKIAVLGAEPNLNVASYRLPISTDRGSVVTGLSGSAFKLLALGRQLMLSQLDVAGRQRRIL